MFQQTLQCTLGSMKELKSQVSSHIHWVLNITLLLLKMIWVSPQQEKISIVTHKFRMLMILLYIPSLHFLSFLFSLIIYAVLHGSGSTRCQSDATSA